MRSGSPSVLRALNEQAALEQLLVHGPLSRLDLENLTGLSKPAMADVLRRLELAGMVVRADSRPSRAGPPAQLWDIEPRVVLVAGIDINAGGLDAGIADITGRLIGQHFLPFDAHAERDAGEALLNVTRGAAKDAGVDIEEIDEIVVGLPGVVDPESGQLTRGRGLPSWQGYDLPAFARKSLGHPRVRIENDVNLAALAELAHGAANGSRAFLVLWIGTGLGMGLVRDGVLIRGGRGAAGEISTAIVPDRSSQRVFGVEGGELQDLLADGPIGSLAEFHGIGPGAAADQVAKAIADPETWAPFLRDVAIRIATALTGPIGLIDPDIVVLTGPIGRECRGPIPQMITEELAAMPAPLPSVRTTSVAGSPIRDGAIQYALSWARARMFKAGSAGRTRAPGGETPG